MSYNISGWKLRSIHLALPLTFDFQTWVRSQPDLDERGYTNYGKLWCIEEQDTAVIQTNLAAQTWKLEICNQELSGVIDDDALIVTALDWRGDSSGYLYSDILLPLFRAFQGALEAIVIWEGGDTIKRLSIRDGVVEDKEME